MKPSLLTAIYPCTGQLSKRLHNKRATLLAFAVATVLGANLAFSQGNYYPPGSPGYPAGGVDTGYSPSGTPVAPPPSSGTYTGISQTTNSNELSYVESILNQLYPNSNLTLHVPVPPGMTPATDNQLMAALQNAAQNLVANPSAVQSSYPGVTLGSVAQQIVADRPSVAGSITYTLVQNSSLSTTDVQSIVNGAVTSAYSTNNQGALSSVVYNAAKAVSAAQTGATLTQSLQAIASQAVSTIKAKDPTNTYIAAAATLAGAAGTTNLAAIRDAAITADGGAGTAITDAYNIVNAIHTTSNTLSPFTKTLNSFSSLPPGAAQDRVLATLYASILADATPTDASALLAAAIAKTTTVSSSNLLTAAINATQSPPQQSRITSLNVASTVATHIAANIAANTNTDVFKFVGYEAAQNPNNVFDVAAAAATVDPNHVNYEAHAIAYNSPATAYQAVAALFNYSQLNTKTKNAGSPSNGITTDPQKPTGVTGPLIDRTSAAAAIVAGLTTGVVETANPAASNDPAVASALKSIVSQAILSAAGLINGRALIGANIWQNNGSTTNAPSATQDGMGGKLTASVGAAGVITGFVSQVVNPGDTTIGNSTVSQADIEAIFTAAANNASAYVLQMAQAAGQALAIVSKNGSLVNTVLTTGTAGSDIARGFFGAGPTGAITGSGIGGWTFTQILNAANYGITQGNNGVFGAGASGVMNYAQHSATGAPVTDIFNL